MKRVVLASLLAPVVVAAFGLLDPPYGPVPADVRADAALVLSGDVDEKRLEKAIDLHSGGRVRAILLTGTGVGGDSALYLKDLARKAGVPEADIVVEGASTTTRENVAGAVPLIRARGWSRVALVTSHPHMGRAIRVARKAAPGIEWVPVAIPEPGSPYRVYRQRLQEWAKLTWYAARGWI